MRKILFLLHLPPPVHGSAIIGKQIYDSKRINTEFECDYINLCTSTEMSSIGSLSFLKFVKYFDIILRLVLKLILNRYDRVYIAPTVTNIGFFKDLVLIIILNVFKCKKILHLHNKGVAINQNSPIYRKLYKIFFKKSKVILLSELLFFEVENFVCKENVFICPNGIENEMNMFYKRKNKECTDLLFLSNLIRKKGVYKLLNVCKRLKELGYNFKCSFVGGEGDISVKDFQNKISLLNLENDVFYLGKKFGEEKKQSFLNSDVFVLPTENETFGLVNLEAMMYGLPVISTYEGSIPDFINDDVNGFLIRNEEQLLTKIIQLIENYDLRLKLGENGWIKFQEYFTVDVFENRMIEILKS